MGQLRFWTTGSPAKLIASSGSPYLCCRCPCVKYYCMMAFKVVPLGGENHDEPNWCSQYVYVAPMGVSTNNTVMLDDVVHLDYSSLSGESMTINANAGIYQQCGTTTVHETIEYEEEPEDVYYRIIAYKVSPTYSCYDEFRTACFEDCPELPCSEYDEQTYECVSHYIPDSAFVFDGSKRPYYGNASNAYSEYYCDMHWDEVASNSLVPRLNITWTTKTLSCTISRDAWDCLETTEDTWCIDWDEDDNCLDWETYEYCVREGLYGASCSINGDTTYHTLIWDGNGSEPERTASANLGWLSSALSASVPLVTAAHATSPSTWSNGYSNWDRNVQCSNWTLSSYQGCGGYAEDPDSKTWRWECAMINLAKPDEAPSTATGIKVRIKTTVVAYSANHTQTTTVYTEERDVLWNTPTYLRVADGLTISATAYTCDAQDPYSYACITPCTGEHESLTYNVSAIDYLYSNN